MKNKPPYAIESVDNALRILQALRDSGRVRVSDLAAELGIARSTAHRLLAMLVYRDFAVQAEDRSYLPGPALSARPLHGEPTQRLRQVLRPHMEALCDQVAETVNLMVRLGTQTRFLHTVESTQILRVGDRQGTILPAWKTSGGKALLAELPDAQLAALLHGAAGRPPDGITDAERRSLVSELRRAREQGYAENIEETESGVCAVGVCVRDRGGEAVAALSVSAPSVRYTPDRVRLFVDELRGAVTRAETDISLLTDGGDSRCGMARCGAAARYKWRRELSSSGFRCGYCADMPAAIMTAVLLDRACRTQLTAMAAGPLRRWGDEEDTVAKRADVWSPRQLQAGYEYLLRRASPPSSPPRAPRARGRR